MKKFIVIALSLAVAGISIGFVSPLFFNTTIDEPLPTRFMMEETLMEAKAYSGMFVGVNDGIHNAEGESKVIPLDNGNRVLRLENFKSTNGPDLYVYLATDKAASDFVDLGRLKANMGNQNYDIPSDVDLEKYNNVLIWCKSFGVLFGSSELTISQ
ncbi:MAG: DM13 domain-containing protein [Nitrosopumilaceae archaeon]